MTAVQRCCGAALRRRWSNVMRLAALSTARGRAAPGSGCSNTRRRGARLRSVQRSDRAHDWLCPRVEYSSPNSDRCIRGLLRFPFAGAKSGNSCRRWRLATAARGWARMDARRPGLGARWGLVSDGDGAGEGGGRRSNCLFVGKKVVKLCRTLPSAQGCRGCRVCPFTLGLFGFVVGSHEAPSVTCAATML